MRGSEKGRKLIIQAKRNAIPLKRKFELADKGRITHVSKPHLGFVHDFRLHKEEPPIHKDTKAFVDSDYQGLDKLHAQTELPYKATKTKPLDEEEKEYNRGLSRLRVVVEHVIRDMKVFRILSERYRNKRKRYGVKFNIIAGIVNLKNGFGFA